MYKYLKNLSKVTIILHWTVAVFILILLPMGIYMANTKSYDIYPLHKSLGILAFIFIITRVFIRITEGWPQPINKNDWQYKLAKVVHWILIISTVIMPISGIIKSVFSSRGLYFFSLTLIEKGTTNINETIVKLSGLVHYIFGIVIIICIILHISGSLKHHFIDKDNTIRRIFGLSFKSKNDT